MSTKNFYETLPPEVMEGEASGVFEESENHPNLYPYRYAHLLAVFLNRQQIEDGDSFYRKVYRAAMRCCTRHLKEKYAHHEVIRVAFVSYSAAQWPAEKLYRDMEKDPRFDPYIIVSPLINRDEENRMRGYTQTLSWFQSNGYHVCGGMRNKFLSWKELGGIPDIVIHLSSWFECLPPSQQFLQLPWTCANIYIDYGMEVGDNQNKTYSRDYLFNKEIVNMMWRIYADSPITLDNYRRHSVVKGENVLFSGYVKMDEMIRPKTYSPTEINTLWKIPGDEKKFKKVIIAPHYSVGFDNIFLSSTFSQNAWFWLYLAEKYRDTVSFLFKPHPNLRSEVVRRGVFTSYEEYDQYLTRWNSLPNAKAIDETKYIDYFLTSDAMILDSCSFIGEYMYAHRPVLYLTRPEQGFTELGQKIVDTYYRTPGWNLTEIERFLREVVIEGNDDDRQNREAVFEEYLDYYRLKGKMAHEIIFSDILSAMEE